MPLHPMPGRRERRRTQTLDLVASTAMQLFEAHGYEATTMEQIALAADVAKGTLYNHFPTKESVLAHWMHLTLAEDAPRLREALDTPGTFEEKLARLLEASADWMSKHRAYLLPYFRHRFLHIDGEHSPNAGEPPRDLAGVFAWLISQAQHEGVLRGDLPAEHFASLLHHLYFGALMRWLTAPDRDLAAEFSAAAGLFLRGALAPVLVPNRSKRP
jgi:TetR/AcrR family transcriptional regulator, regulator of autoinduction and epiphytic fitness